MKAIFILIILLSSSTIQLKAQIAESQLAIIPLEKFVLNTQTIIEYAHESGHYWICGTPGISVDMSDGFNWKMRDAYLREGLSMNNICRFSWVTDQIYWRERSNTD